MKILGKNLETRTHSHKKEKEHTHTRSSSRLALKDVRVINLTELCLVLENKKDNPKHAQSIFLIVYGFNPSFFSHEANIFALAIVIYCLPVQPCSQQSARSAGQPTVCPSAQLLRVTLKCVA